MTRMVVWLVVSWFALEAQVWAQSFDQAKDQNWHQWRGPAATGVSATAQPPVKWSADENIRWKVAIQGQGNSTPIIWETRSSC